MEPDRHVGTLGRELAFAGANLDTTFGAAPDPDAVDCTVHHLLNPRRVQVAAGPVPHIMLGIDIEGANPVSHSLVRIGPCAVFILIELHCMDVDPGELARRGAFAPLHVFVEEESQVGVNDLGAGGGSPRSDRT